MQQSTPPWQPDLASIFTNSDDVTCPVTITMVDDLGNALDSGAADLIKINQDGKI